MIEQFHAIVKVLVLCYLIYVVYFGMKNLLKASTISEEEKRQFTVISFIIVVLIILVEGFEKFWSE